MQRFEHPGEDLRNFNFEELDLANDLIGANLQGAQLQGVILEGANLTGANLTGANLKDAYLSQINLTNANLQGTTIIDAELVESILTDATLSGANLSGSTFRGAILIRALLNDTQCVGSIFEDANLTESDLRSANLTSAYLRGANLTRADLRRARLTDANLTGANLTESDLRRARLIGTDLTDANLTGADLIAANLTNADLNRANLTGADLYNTTLTDADFTEVILTADDLQNIQDQLTEDQQEQINPQDQQAPQVPQVPQVQGMAYEVHNLFNSLDMPSITEYIKTFNDTTPVNNNTTSNSSQSGNNLFTPLLTFIDNSTSFVYNEKDENKQKLTGILQRLQTLDNFEQRHRRLIQSVVDFVSRQEDVFIEQYIRILSDECLNAYGTGNQSCLKGVFERLITTLNSVAIALTTDPQFENNQNYKDIKKLFKNIDFNETVQEWASMYLQDGEKEDDLKTLTVPEKKEHFINFMRHRYGSLLTQGIEKQIINEANEYETNQVFERMAFGRKGNRKTKIRSTTKRNKSNIKRTTKRNKKMKKYRKTMHKIKNKKTKHYKK